MGGYPQCNGHTNQPQLPALLPARAPAYATAAGACYQGDSAELLKELEPEAVALVMTSPPFPLHRPKLYGNPTADEYIAWLMPIARQIHRVLRHDGSFVLEVSGAWNAGMPTRSMLPYALTLELGALFYLAQDFYWHHTRPLPGPPEWVCRRRVRVTEAVTQLLWWTKSPEPYTDQRAVLVPYKRELNGINDGERPSGHRINGTTWHDNGGAIPPNVFTLPGLDGRDTYAQRCRAEAATIHPARMPPELPDFFVRLCSRVGDLVLDPFAGSNTTGHVAEGLGRCWLSLELNHEYVASSALRFAAAAGDA